jgi:hypothetical protein
MSYSKLNINRKLITQVLSNHVESLSTPETKGNNEVHYRGKTQDDNAIFIIFYFNVDGTTSISPRDPNIETGTQLADLIVKECGYSDKKSVELFIPLESDDFDTIIDYLVSECDAIIQEEKVIGGGKQLKLTGSSGSQLILKYYTKKANLQVQGKPLELYEDLIEILSDILPYEQYVKSQLKLMKVELEPSVIKNELECRLTHSYDFLGNKLTAIISPSLALNKLDIELEDYTAVAMPVLRGIEGYLKLLFRSKGYTIERSFGDVIIGNNGNQSISPTLKATVKANINCSYTSDAIEQCYSYWAQQRHGLFHMDAIIETTRTLTKDVANKIIEETLSLIENTYTAIPKTN